MPNIKPTTTFNPNKYVPITAIPLCPLCGNAIERGSLNWTFSPTKERLGKYTGSYVPMVPHVWRHYDCSNFTSKNTPSTNPPASPENPAQPTTAPTEPISQPPIEQPKPFEDSETFKPETPKPTFGGTSIKINPLPSPKANEHKQFQKLKRLMELRKNVYLGGDPGSGKSYNIKEASKQIVSSIGETGLRYAFLALSTTTMPSYIFGYQDLAGNFVETLFYDFYKNGGTLDIAELDNCSNNLFTLLNNALENGECFFLGRTKDEPMQRIPRHPDFICVGNGNTDLKGPTDMFPGREQQDAAAVARFVMLKWEYDTEGELARCMTSYGPTFVPVIKWAQALRALTAPGKSGNVKHDELVISQREMFHLCDCIKAGFDKLEAVHMCVFKGYDSGRVTTLLSACPINF